MKANQLPASEVKVHFGDILNRVIYAKQSIVITKHHKAVAVIVGIDEWQRKNQKTPEKTPRKKSQWLIESEALREKLRSYRKKNAIIDTLDSVKLIRETRDEMSRI